jgi:hypothetical protein
MRDDGLLRRVQAQLMQYYALDALPSVEHFVRPCSGDRRERVVVRQAHDGVEVAVELPAWSSTPTLDAVCQLVEGVSHFVLLAERARRELPTTQLELELQAEVDKFVMLAVQNDELEAREALTQLYGSVRYVDPPGTERGDRYRVANRLAKRFVQHLERQYIRRDHLGAMRDRLRHFYRVGQAGKVALAEAA